MKLLTLASFFVGMLLLVRAMFFGMERRRAAKSDPAPVRRSETAFVAFLVVFGAVGYLMGRRGDWSASTLLVAAIAGAVAAAIAIRGAIAMAKIQPEHDPEDPRYVLQGHAGRVTREIAAGGEGAIVFTEHDRERTVRARAIDDTAIAAGEEVIIERLEDDVAYVELWARVEERL